MENPNSWGKVRKAINTALTEYQKQVDEDRFGLSLVSVIYNELRKNNYCVDETNDCICSHPAYKHDDRENGGGCFGYCECSANIGAPDPNNMDGKK